MGKTDKLSQILTINLTTREPAKKSPTFPDQERNFVLRKKNIVLLPDAGEMQSCSEEEERQRKRGLRRRPPGLKTRFSATCKKPNTAGRGACKQL
jgi:hypothetical protein